MRDSKTDNLYRFQIRDIVNRYKSGETTKSISRDYHIRISTIHSVLKKEKVLRNPGSPKYVPTAEEILALTKDIRSQWDEETEISRRYSLPWTIPEIKCPTFKKVV